MSALITFCHVDNVEVLSAVGNAAKKGTKRRCDWPAIESCSLLIALPLPAMTMRRVYFIENYAADKRNTDYNQARRRHVAIRRSAFNVDNLSAGSLAG